VNSADVSMNFGGVPEASPRSADAADERHRQTKADAAHEMIETNTEQNQTFAQLNLTRIVHWTTADETNHFDN
jgi:hypothetical protein